MTKIKEKLSSAKRWVKKNIKKVLIATGIVGAVLAAETLIQPTIPSTIAEGQVISFPYTDGNSNEDLIIYTDKQVYTPLWVWNGFDVYMAVKNNSGISQPVSFQSFFSKNFTIEKVDILNPTATSTIKEPIYQDVCKEVIATSTNATTTTCYQKQTGEKDRVILGIWNTIPQQQFSKEAYDKTILDNNIPVKQKIGDKVAGNFIDYSLKGEFSYYKLRVKANETFDKEEFFIEAIGQNGAYGILDPTILTETFNSYTDGDLNGQGSWSGNVAFDVQGTTTAEGAKAVIVQSLADNFVEKTGASTTDGAIVIYFRKNSCSDGQITLRLYQGTTESVTFYIQEDCNILYINSAATGVSIGTYEVDDWNSFQVEWRSSDTTVRYQEDGNGWTGWVAPYSAFSTGLDKVRIGAYSVDTASIYFDYIAETPIAGAVEEAIQGQTIDSY